MQVADQQSANGANTGETPTREMRHNPVSVHERPSYSRNFKDLRQMISQVRIHTSQPTSPRSQGQTCGPGPVARKNPRFRGFCAGRGRARDRERPVIAGNAASARYFLCRPFWWSHNAVWWSGIRTEMPRGSGKFAWPPHWFAATGGRLGSRGAAATRL